MRSIITFIFTIPFFTLLAQDCETPKALVILKGNNIAAPISNSGDLFRNAGRFGQFIVPAEDPDRKATIRATGLWLGGFDPAGNLKVAAQIDGRDTGNKDYIPGPLQPFQGVPYNGLCEEFDQIWTITQQDIVNHLADFSDNGMIDSPNPRIYAWPGTKNPHFESTNGFKWPESSTAAAPFKDVNFDNIYNPDDGDYPHYASIAEWVLPNMMTWTVFNDATFHTHSGGNPIRADIELLSWNFKCDDNEILNNTLFTAHKITNQAVESIDSFYIGLWVDFDLGCNTDDYIGSTPDHNAFFAYNADSEDGDGSGTSSGCFFGFNTYKDNPPVQSVKFLNHPLSKFTYYNDPSTTNYPGIVGPGIIALEYYSYLSGSWRDRTYFTTGGTGYDLTNPQVTDYAFPDDPNDPNGWSMINEALPFGDRKAIGSYLAGRLEPGHTTTLETAFTFHQKDNLDHLSNVTQMYKDLEALQQMHNSYYSGFCQNNVVSAKEIIPDAAFSLSPNPTTGLINLQLHDLELDRLKVFDLQGRMLMEWSDLSGSMDIDLSGLSAGMYLVRLESAGSVATRKVVRL